MADITLVSTITRTLLGLGNLSLNDHVKFTVAGPALWVGSRRWKRDQVDAPDVYGEVTVHRKLTNATDPLTIYVGGSTPSALDANCGELVEAFSQARFVLQQQVDGVDHQWDCEAADVDSVSYDSAHVASRYVAITFAIPHYPIPLVGSL